MSNVAEIVMCSLNFPPGHKARLHFPEPLAVMWDHIAEYWWMNVDRVMYTTSNLAPKNRLPNLLCSLFLFSSICQLESEDPGEDSKTLEDGQYLEGTWEYERLHGTKPCPHPRTDFQETEEMSFYCVQSLGCLGYLFQQLAYTDWNGCQSLV